jgi:LPPG:FO 2-phospho-L-lactate transferase
VTRVVGLGGGIGASRLWRALARAVGPDALTLVVNTGDDLWHHGLRVCPDLDTTLYALSGRQDTERGWGVRGETWRTMDALRELGHEVWFNLGDRDLATHLLRTGLLRDGIGLAGVTARLASAMGVGVRVLPMTEDEVATRIETADGRDLHYEEFLVQHGAAAPVRRVRHDGADAAAPAPGVLDAVAAADVVVLGPSNPVASIDPILAVPGLRSALRAAVDVVAVTSIVARVPVAGTGEERRATSRAALLAADGLPATATTVARRYRDLCHRFVLDSADAEEAEAIRAAGLQVAIVPTLLHRDADGTRLVDAVLGAGQRHRDVDAVPSPAGRA